MKKVSNVTFEITESIGIVRDDGEWKMELNMVSWNGGKAKFDLRSWNSDHTKMSKGVTLTEEDMKTLKSLITKRI